MGKAITNIRMADDGTISFDFMGGDAMAIQEIHQDAETDLWFSLDGRRIQSKPTQHGLYINNGKIAIIK